MQAMPQEAVLLVGGLGTRLGSLTKNFPKPMLPINERPFLEYLLSYLRDEGIRKFILAVAHHPELIERYFGHGAKLGVEILYSDPQGRQLGTGGALKFAEPLIAGEEFFVLNGDVFFGAGLRELWQNGASRQAMATLALARVADRSRYGSVEFDEKGYVQKFLEKNNVAAEAVGYINGGLYVFRRRVLELIPSNQDVSLEYAVFPRLIGQRALRAVPFPQAYFIDIGTPRDYTRAQAELPQKIPLAGV